MKKTILNLILLLIFFSSNGYSQGWQAVSSGTPYILYGMTIPPGQNNVAYSAGMQYTYDSPGVIVKTTNNGETWAKILPVSGEIDGLQAICFIDEDNGFAGGWNNYFIKTTDGGSTWTNVTVGNDIWYFTDIKFWDSNNGIAAAKMEDGSGKIFVTADGGNVWTQSTGITAEPFGVDYADASTLFAVCADNKIYKSTNSGSSWNSIYDADGLVLGVSFSNSNFGVVGGEDGAIYATTDGGSNWSTFSTGYHNFWAAYAFEGDSAYVGGTDEDIYKTTDGGATWTTEYNGSSDKTLYRIEFTENGTGLSCGSGGTMIRKDPPLGADFEADETEICAGGTVQFTDFSTDATSWSWTFEGGDPVFSTDQNPTVVYNNVGIYDVTLEVSNGAGNATLVKQDYISVMETPGQASTPVGDVELCNGNSYEYSTDPVDYAQSYTWTVAPPAAGTFNGNGNEVVFNASSTWTGNFTIKVKAINICGDGEWSEGLSCALFASPQQFEMTGGGEICEGSSGLEIGIDGSQVGVDYELFNNNVSTEIIVAGTGQAISFGLIITEGNYSAIGTNDNCFVEMIGEPYIVVNQLPNQLSRPDGLTGVCNNGENEYTTTGGEESDVITWTLSPEEAGSVVGDGMTATVTWNYTFDGSAFLSAQAENTCGYGEASDELEIHVFGVPNPEISGSALVCINEEDTYSTVENENNSYEWEVIGGTITSGDGTNEISVLWSNNPGQGFVIVNESATAGCSTIDAFAVSIDDCLAIETNLQNSNLYIYPNPAQSSLNLDFSADNGQQIEINIYNSMGMLIMQKMENSTGEKQTCKFNIEGLSKGTYIISVKYPEQKVWTGKFNKN